MKGFVCAGPGVAEVPHWSAKRQQFLLETSRPGCSRRAMCVPGRELMGAQQAADPHAMPLDQFISEAMSLFKAQLAGGEIVVERCKPLRIAAENGKFADVFRLMNPVQNASRRGDAFTLSQPLHQGRGVSCLLHSISIGSEGPQETGAR